jgi:hypothetical protein
MMTMILTGAAGVLLVAYLAKRRARLKAED